MKAIKKTALIIFCVIYFIAMAYLLFLKNLAIDSSLTYAEYIKSSFNIIPFFQIYDFFRMPTVPMILIKFYVIGFVGNVVMFIPFGTLISYWTKWNVKKILLTSLVIILAVECIQLFLRLGAFDIDDVIFNLLGVFIGNVIYKKLLVKLSEK